MSDENEKGLYDVFLTVRLTAIATSEENAKAAGMRFANGVLRSSDAGVVEVRAVKKPWEREAPAEPNPPQ